MTVEPVEIDGRDHLTTAQTAAYLGVRVQSVYAYVSRGLLRRTTIPGHRGSYFALAEVEDLQSRGRAPRAAGAGSRIHTQITLVDETGRLAYRGHDVPGLVRDGSRFEDVCGILWRLDGPADLRGTASMRTVAARARGALPPGARTLDVVKVVVDLLGAADPLRHDLRPTAVAALAERTLGSVVDAIGAAGASAAAEAPEGPPGEPVAARLHAALSAGAPRAGGERVVDAALCLLADHDLAMSTRAARMAASVRAHPYAVLGAGLGALDSPLHGIVPRSAYRLLEDVLAGPDAAIASVVAAGAPPPGFGHLVYRESDPRAETLLAMLRELAGPEAAVMQAADELCRAMAAWRDVFPNSDFALAVLAHVLELGAQAGEVIFTVARLAGWVAHALEEYESEPLRYRIPGVYSGPRPSERSGPTAGSRRAP